MGIFAGLRVLELSSVLAGPAAGVFFAELGADVVKVESPAGDVTRSWRLAGEAEKSDVSAYFAAVNWGKRSVVLNLKQPEDLQALYRLASVADVVLCNYKPGDAEKLGVDYTTLAALNPKLIYAHLTGYGPDNPRAGFDALVQAEAGFMYLNGAADGPPTKMPIALLDLMAAHQLKEAVLVALWQRERTGGGAHLQVSLIASAIASLANQATAWLVAHQLPQRIGSEHPSIVPYGTIFTTQDGLELVLAVGTDRQFHELCAVLGAPALARNEHFATNPVRVQHRKSLLGLLQELIGQQARGPLLTALQGKQVPAGEVNDVPAALALPAAQPLLLQGQGQQGLRTVAFAPAGWLTANLTPPAPLGAHTAEVLQEWAAYTPEELALVDQAGAAFVA